MKEIVIRESYVGLLYEDGAYVKTLKPGKHKFPRKIFDKVSRTVGMVDVRERSLTIKGQEILTSDKVAIRVSLLVYYRITDPVAATHNVSSFEDRIYEDVQLAARRFLASRTLDLILTDRNEISEAVKTDVTESAAGYGVEVIRADVKDLVFPGNLREIMNMVIETERKAEAKIIEARNEAEALRIQNEARNAAEIDKINAEKEMIRVSADAELEKFRSELEMKTKEAEALKAHPELLKILQLQMLKEFAGNGARLVLGLDGETVKTATEL
ncbi:MAG: SPFH domain-containing protein [Verrucomicrobiota bacterium]